MFTLEGNMVEEPLHMHVVLMSGRFEPVLACYLSEYMVIIIKEPTR